MISLLLATGFPPQVGGIQTILHEVAEHLPAGQVEVLAPRTAGAAEFDATCAQLVHRRDFASRKPLQRLAGRVLGRTVSPLLTQLPIYLSYARELIRTRSIDVVQCGHVSVAGVGYALKLLYGLPYVVYTYAQEIMDARIPKSMTTNRVLGRTFLGNASIVFTLSRFTREQVVQWGVREDSVVRIPLGPSPCPLPTEHEMERARERLGLRGKRVILTVGRLVKRKGQDMTIRALPSVLARVPDVAYVIVGKGPMDAELRAEVRHLALEDRVVFAGDVPHNQIGVYYAMADVFVMPSRDLASEGDVEGFGLVYLEANAYSKPCVGGRSGGVPDAVLDGETGILVNPWDQAEIANAIVRLLLDAELALQMGSDGRARIAREMNWQRSAQVVRASLHRALERR